MDLELISDGRITNIKVLGCVRTPEEKLCQCKIIPLAGCNGECVTAGHPPMPCVVQWSSVYQLKHKFK